MHVIEQRLAYQWIRMALEAFACINHIQKEFLLIRFHRIRFIGIRIDIK